ncbi:MAG: class I SAM-dependent methyltransferase [Candidatus Loosdrechtia sp.]|uniref:class I SAM-dependent methyltransferase n=1 Tax=Candidatus Loosdrechtia sp. TaxID=3101272 RepID=UPI003A74CA55|nr:MAG: class I SAM-dependent methyltransferase [Candidatus Jettenia sp. AMX2]
MPDRNCGREKEIRQKYDTFASFYNLIEGIPELFVIRHLRKKLIPQATGKVLEIAVGTGKNLCYYPEICQITGIDNSTAMVKIARKRMKKLKRHVTFFIMDASTLAFRDQSFDTVVSSLCLCTFADPVAALIEMDRVCRTDGQILLLEHGRSSQKWLRSLQDCTVDCCVKGLGCHWNREPLNLIRQAGLRIVYAQCSFLGVFYLIKARPSGVFGNTA